MKTKEVLAGYITSSYFENIYLHLAKNKLPSSKAAVTQVETQGEKYLLFDSFCSGYKISYYTKLSTLHT